MSEAATKSTDGAGDGTDSDAFRVSPDYVREVVGALDDGDSETLHELTGDLHEADLADLIGIVSPEQRRDLLHMMRDRLDPRVLSELDVSVLESVVEILEPERLAEVVTELPEDEAVSVLADLKEEDRQAILEEVPLGDRIAIEASLEYPEESAGRLMQRDLIAVPAYWDVGQTIDYMRETEDLPNEFYEIFVVDPRYRVLGTVALDRIMRSQRPVPVSEIMDDEPRTIPVDMDQEEVGHIFRQYNLLSAPVVNAADRLVGMVTIDDVVDVVGDEVEEDIMLMAGVGADDVHETTWRTTRTRFTWLVVNLFTAILASLVIAQFDATIEQLVALAVLMPIVASMGGNAGTQTMTVAVRALATRELTTTNAMRSILKEVRVGGINGVLLAILIGLIAGAWFQNVALGSVLGAAMIINMLVAGLSGILIPMALDRIKIDPAVASSVFVTTITDIVGFFAFLGLAAIYLL